MKNPHNKTELYLGGITNRFAAYTGDAVNDEPLEGMHTGPPDHAG